MSSTKIAFRIAALSMAVTAGLATATGDWTDPAGDARIRRTDGGANAPLLNPGALPDVISLELTGWLPDAPESDPYLGVVDASHEPDLFRLALTFEGLVNPPGPLGLSGMPYDPARFGPRPVYGFVEFDLDRDHDSGGEQHAVAINRYLANAARFGSIPQGVERGRLVLDPGDTDSVYATEPQYERTGAEFALAMCGCWDLTVVDEGGAPDGAFDAGDTWIVRGRFLERAQAFSCLSFVFGSAANGGPSGFGQYDPVTEARFTHDTQTDRTTLEIVWPLTPSGAAMLTGETPQPIDFTFGNGNHFSLEEALVDLRLGAQSASGMCGQFAYGWDEIDLHPEYGESIRPLDPTRWRAKGILGTAYQAEQPDAVYAWTDAVFGDVFGDVSGDGDTDSYDTSTIEDAINDHDGKSEDLDGLADGRWTYAGFGPNFSVYDLNYDGAVGPEDTSVITPSCPADLADPEGVLDLADIGAFVTGFTTQSSIADLTGEGIFDLSDITVFINSFMQGCDP